MTPRKPDPTRAPPDKEEAPRTPAPDWSHAIPVTDIPPAGLHCRLAPVPEIEQALGKRAGVSALAGTQAEFDLRPLSGGRIAATGHVRARVTQACVVTLEPVESALDEPIDVIFLPEGTEIPAHADDETDPPEPIVNGTLDLGRLAAEYLILGIDPYPRKPGVAFAAEAAPLDPADHPFAALGALKKPDPPRN